MITIGVLRADHVEAGRDTGPGVTALTDTTVSVTTLAQALA